MELSTSGDFHDVRNHHVVVAIEVSCFVLERIGGRVGGTDKVYILYQTVPTSRVTKYHLLILVFRDTLADYLNIFTTRALDAEFTVKFQRHFSQLLTAESTVDVYHIIL
jgi:hypothetical protein